jgi:hypothetical protein
MEMAILEVSIKTDVPQLPAHSPKLPFDQFVISKTDQKEVSRNENIRESIIFIFILDLAVKNVGIKKKMIKTNTIG